MRKKGNDTQRFDYNGFKDFIQNNNTVYDWIIYTDENQPLTQAGNIIKYNAVFSKMGFSEAFKNTVHFSMDNENIIPTSQRKRPMWNMCHLTIAYVEKVVVQSILTGKGKSNNLDTLTFICEDGKEYTFMAWTPVIFPPLPL